MVSGTKDEYVIPEDLVEEVASLCRLAQQPQFASDFESSQLNAVAVTRDAIAQYGRHLFAKPLTITATLLVREDPDWVAMRSAAADCLAAFGIDASTLKVDEID